MQLSRPSLFVGVLVLFLLIGGVLFFTRTEENSLPPSKATTSTQSIASGTPDLPIGGDKVAPTGTSPLLPTTKKSNTVPTPILKRSAVLTGHTAPEIVRPTGFTNIDTLGIISTDQFTLKRFIGKKVILLEFWTTSSVNSMRTIPYFNQWYSKYKDDGLLIVTVHTPQFTYEKSKVVVDQVAFAKQMNFPIVIDNQYLTWNAYKNNVWPHLYLIDMSGNIVYDHAGDGAYEATEAKLEELLTARGKKLNVPFAYRAFTTPKDAFITDATQLGSSETFFGAARNQSLVGGVPLKAGTQSFETIANPKLNTIALSGSWNFTDEYAMSMTENTIVDYRYRAASVYATLSADKLIRVKVLRDGKPIDGTTAGKEVRFEKGESVFYVKDARIYEIIKDGAGYGEHTITLVPEGGGLKVFVLMFG